MSWQNNYWSLNDGKLQALQSQKRAIENQSALFL
jgi:hypothetical protein